MSELPATWALVALDNVGSWGSGGTPPKGNSSYYEGNLPWAVIGDLDDGPLIKTERSISELGLKNSSAKLVSRGTILIAMYGSIGKLAITQMECCTNQAIAFCKEDGELTDKKYPELCSKRTRLICHDQTKIPLFPSRTGVFSWLNHM